MADATPPPSDLAARLAAEGARLEPCRFDDLPGWGTDGFAAAYAAFAASARFAAAGAAPLRPGIAAPSALRIVFAAAQAASLPEAQARAFFETHFVPYRIVPASGSGFLTGYYEPEVEGSRSPSPEFAEPILARPADLATFAQGEHPLGAPLAAGRRRQDGTLEPYATRAEIEAGATAGTWVSPPLVWLRDGIEAFMVHVQGSARVRLAEGGTLRLTYAGRNGRAYTSIGRRLVERGEVPLADMSLERLKAWVRDAGQRPGEPGRRLMQENESFIFFAANEALDSEAGPIGAEGVSLTPLRSIAVDRTLWPYGLPFWIAADLPWRTASAEPFRRLMVAQDTGSAILGPARADLYFGTGAECGILAGGIRHAADMAVLLPRSTS